MPKKQANPVDAHVGHRVRLRRMLVGMSQERLGELLGLTFQQVQKYEKGINRIGAGRLFEVAGFSACPSASSMRMSMPGVRQAGSPRAGEPPPVMEFLSSGEGLQLSLAFMRIKDVKVRRRILDLVRSLADVNEVDDGKD